MAVNTNANYYTKEEYEAAKSVNLIDYLQDCGFELKKSGRNDYMLKIHDSLKISVDGHKWRWYSRDLRGNSPVELVKNLDLFNGDIKRIVKDMAQYAEGRGYVILPEYPDQIERKKSKEDELKEAHEAFTLPERNETSKRAYAYLVKERAIDPGIVSDLIKQGKIYESKKFHNVVFVGQKDETGKVLHASLRGTYTKGKAFKGDCTYADKMYSFAMEGKTDRLIVCESAIDAMSQATITKLAGRDWRQDHRIALGCLSDDALTLYLKRHPNIKQIKFCLDNDKDGKDYLGNPHNHGQEATKELKEKYQDLGYQVSSYVPFTKDLNEDLKAIRANLSKDHNASQKEDAAKEVPLMTHILNAQKKQAAGQQKGGYSPKKLQPAISR